MPPPHRRDMPRGGDVFFMSINVFPSIPPAVRQWGGFTIPATTDARPIPKSAKGTGWFTLPEMTNAAPPADETCRAAGMFFHANQCVSVDPASCPAMGLVYILKEDKCLASEQICREANMAFLNNRCVALTPEYCRQMGQFLDNNQCVAKQGDLRDARTGLQPLQQRMRRHQRRQLRRGGTAATTPSARNALRLARREPSRWTTRA